MSVCLCVIVCMFVCYGLMPEINVHSFLCLTVHRQIAGDIDIYLKFVLKVTHPFRKRRFRHISLTVTQLSEPVKKFNYR